MRPVVLCPLEFEARAIRPRIGDRAEVIVSGLGSRSGATAQRLLNAVDPPSILLVAGVCGGLRDAGDSAEGHAVRVERVVTPAGDSWQCPIVWSGAERGGASGSTPDATAATLVAVDSLIASPRDKRALASSAGAAYVDMESHHVARVCAAAAVRWGVARAVSDGASRRIPTWLIRSITPDGRTRTAYSAGQTLLRLWQLPTLLAILRSTRVAADAAGRAAADMLDAEAAGNDATQPGGIDSAPRAATSGPPFPPETRCALIVGGTFDPPHVAHVRLSREAAAHVGADRRVFIPAARSPFKHERPMADDADRVEMLRLALADEPGATIWTYEIDRAGRTEPSYTIDALRALRSAAPGVRLRLFLGADQAAEFHRWKNAREVIALAEPVVALRTPFTDAESLVRALAPHWSAEELDAWRRRVAPISVHPASATALRHAPESASPAWARDVDPRVRAYIARRGLYRAGSPSGASPPPPHE